MNREQAETLLAALVADELDEPYRGELLAYLKTDSAMADRLGDMRLAARLLREGLVQASADVPTALGDDQRAALLALAEREPIKAVAAEQVPSAHAKPGLGALFTIRIAGAVAACVALGVGLLGIMLPELGEARRTARRMQSESSVMAEYFYDSAEDAPEYHGEVPSAALSDSPHSPSAYGVFGISHPDQVDLAGGTRLAYNIDPTGNLLGESSGTLALGDHRDGYTTLDATRGIDSNGVLRSAPPQSPNWQSATKGLSDLSGRASAENAEHSRVFWKQTTGSGLASMIGGQLPSDGLGLGTQTGDQQRAGEAGLEGLSTDGLVALTKPAPPVTAAPIGGVLDDKWSGANRSNDNHTDFDRDARFGSRYADGQNDAAQDSDFFFAAPHLEGRETAGLDTLRWEDARKAKESAGLVPGKQSHLDDFAKDAGLTVDPRTIGTTDSPDDAVRPKPSEPDPLSFALGLPMQQQGQAGEKLEQLDRRQVTVDRTTAATDIATRENERKDERLTEQSEQMKQQFGLITELQAQRDDLVQSLIDERSRTRQLSDNYLRIQEESEQLSEQFGNAPSFDLNGALSNANSGGGGGGGDASGLFGDEEPRGEADRLKNIETKRGKTETRNAKEVDRRTRELDRANQTLRNIEATTPEIEPDRPAPAAVPVNPWVLTANDAQSTFALDTDSASYELARRTIREQAQLPPIGSVRMEEFVNRFEYQYPAGRDAHDTFTVHAEAGPAPFAEDGVVLLKVGVRGRVVARDQMKPAHYVFVIDASGSMARADRLPLVQQSLAMLLGQLGESDTVSLVSYETRPYLLLEHAPANKPGAILDAAATIQTGGSTNLTDGLKLGYQVAGKHFAGGGVNRVILCSDGVANVGNDDAKQMLDAVNEYRRHGVTLMTVGVGVDGQLAGQAASGAERFNDGLMEQLANQGDGQYVYLGSAEDAQRQFVEDLAATRPTIAYDAKIQVQFDPSRVRRYRLIGYENRDIADRDFRNDAVDAGEVGSGQSATALYEVEPWPIHRRRPVIGNQQRDASLGTVFVRYRDAQSGAVEETETALSLEVVRERTVAENPRFYLAACAAEFAELLRDSEHAAGGSYARLHQVAREVAAALPLDRDAAELAELIGRAQGLPRAGQ